MPASWKPAISDITDQIAEEQSKIDFIQKRRQWVSRPLPMAQPIPTMPVPSIQQGVFPSSQNKYIPPHLPSDEEVQQLTTQGVIQPNELSGLPKMGEAEQANTPLWQKGINAFTAPFNWVSENVTEPFGAIATSPFTSSEG